MAKEEEVKATFASLAALNERGDYAGASGLMSTYAVLANEVKELKDKETLAKERILTGPDPLTQTCRGEPARHDS